MPTENAKRIVIDPLTRIEGHLRIELQAGEGTIEDAWACTTQFRGIEVVMKNRDPRRRLGLCPAHLWRLHRCPRAGLHCRR